MKKNITIPVILAALLATQAHSQTVLNNSFEDGIVRELGKLSTTELGSATHFIQNPSNWSTSENVGLIRGVTTHLNYATVLYNGGTAAIKQSISFATAGSYSLTFDSFTVADPTGSGLGSEFSATIGSTTNNYTELSNGSHTTRTINFNVAAPGNVTLLFQDISATAKNLTNATYLDNINISAVPEPSSAALLGLAGIGLITRRQRK